MFRMTADKIASEKKNSVALIRFFDNVRNVGTHFVKEVAQKH